MPMVLPKSAFILIASALLFGCGTSPGYPVYQSGAYGSAVGQAQSPRIVSPYDRPSMTPIPRQGLRNGMLADRVTFSQKDRRWGADQLGRGGGSLAAEGCVVTSAAMAMTNSGFSIDPGDLNRRLTQSNNLTRSGLLKWKGISEVSGGRVKATFYESVSEPLIQQCLAKGDYPLVRFFLPNGRSHWAMILGRSDKGYHMRDPLRVSNKPLVFPRDSSAFKSLRCIGPA